MCPGNGYGSGASTRVRERLVDGGHICLGLQNMIICIPCHRQSAGKPQDDEARQRQDGPHVIDHVIFVIAP